MRIKATFISEIVLTLVSVQKHQSFFYVLSTPHGKKTQKFDLPQQELDEQKLNLESS